MEKHEIIVPKGIRFVGEVNPETKKRIWEDYDIWNYDFPHILNKELTGCGYTEYCLNCIHPVVLISPRRFLLKNKLDQHPGDVYYFQNDDEVSTDYELDVGDDKKGIKEKGKTMEEGKNETLTEAATNFFSGMSVTNDIYDKTKKSVKDFYEDTKDSFENDIKGEKSKKTNKAKNNRSSEPIEYYEDKTILKNKNLFSNDDENKN
jgi:hypothetical protein